MSRDRFDSRVSLDSRQWPVADRVIACGQAVPDHGRKGDTIGKRREIL